MNPFATDHEHETRTMKSTYRAVLLGVASFAASLAPAAQTPTALPDFTDCDGDGWVDLLMIDADASPRLMLNAGDGSFVDASPAGWPAGLRARSAHFEWLDGDAHAEIVLIDADGRLRILAPVLPKVVGAPMFVEAPLDEPNASGLAAVESVNAADFDHDGTVDLWLETQQGPVLLRGLGELSFEELHLPSTVTGSSGATILGTTSRPTDATESAFVAADTGGSTSTAQAAAAAPLASPAATTSLGEATAPPLGQAAGTPPGATPPLETVSGGCADTIFDQAGGGCIEASSTPTAGSLLPLGPELFVDPAGNVGIGTTSPQDKLHVAGEVSVEGDIDMNGFNIFHVSEISFDNSGAGVIEQTDPASPLILHTAAHPDTGPQITLHPASSGDFELVYGNDSDPNEGDFRIRQRTNAGISTKMIVDSFGNVGIGNAAPTERLDVSGTVRMAPSAFNRVLVEPGDEPLVVDSDFSARVVVEGGATNDDVLLKLSETETAQQWHVGMDNNPVDARGDFSIKEGNSTAPYLMVESGTGNVGIGTMTPTARLDVDGDFEVDAGTLFVDASADEVDVGGAFSVGASSLEVDPVTGFVGIGTAAPSTQLEVVGDLSVDGGTLAVDSSTGEVTIGGSLEVDNGLLLALFSNDVVSIDGDLIVGGDRLVVEDQGDVGIGTSSPSALLEVDGGMVIDSTTLVVSEDANRVGIGTASPLAELDVVGSMRVDGDTLFVDDQSGNVGIGTTSPTEKLTVDGIVESKSGGFRFPDGTVQTLAAQAPPAGLIVMWSGSLASKPSGWKLCDGTNGTPDLRDRFIRGAAIGQNPGSTGGSLTHDHALQDDYGITQSASSTVMVEAGSDVSVATSNHFHEVEAISIEYPSQVHLPPFYKVAFLMKE